MTSYVAGATARVFEEGTQGHHQKVGRNRISIAPSPTSIPVKEYITRRREMTFRGGGELPLRRP